MSLVFTQIRIRLNFENRIQILTHFNNRIRSKHPSFNFLEGVYKDIMYTHCSHPTEQQKERKCSESTNIFVKDSTLIPHSSREAYFNPDFSTILYKLHKIKPIISARSPIILLPLSLSMALPWHIDPPVSWILTVFKRWIRILIVIFFKAGSGSVLRFENNNPKHCLYISPS